MTLSLLDVLGPEGSIARRLPGYETRREQWRVSEAVAAAIEAGEHLVVEAGTGVGKSFAYLVPAILAATAGQAAEPRRSDDEDDEDEPSAPRPKRKRIVVSTHTIALQEQLIRKDIPFLNAVIPLEFSAVLAKGRSNYISLRRMQAAGERAKSTLDFEDDRQLRQLREWSKTTTDGSLADLDFRPNGVVWDEVKSEHGNCLGKKCPTYQQCHYYKARRRIWNADLIVVNHALLMSDLALRREGAQVLPDYDILVIDEAHTLEDVAAEHLGHSLSSGQFDYMYNKLYSERGGGKGLFIHHSLPHGQQLVHRLRSLTANFFEDVRIWKESQSQTNGRARKPLPIEDEVTGELRALATTITDYAVQIKPETQQIELLSAAEKLQGMAKLLEQWIKQSVPDLVYWVETTSGRYPSVKAMSSPVNVGPLLRECLFDQVKTVIMASATLTIAGADFTYFRQRVGLTKTRQEKQGSPFNFERQCKLIVVQGIPDPSERPQEYEAAAIQAIPRYVAQTNGGTFVLFTSYKMLKLATERLSHWFTERNLTLLTQGEGANRTAMIDRFKADGRAVLFGTDSFWQGVDIPGNALQNVIITKLPFSVPDHPLLEARVEQIKARGGNAFMEYQVPEATIKLRQGFGRLIRTQTDTGQVVILDPRVHTKRYGKIFLDSLPKCHMVTDQWPFRETP